MAEVGHVTPGKPIWPEHHGEIPERRVPRKDEEPQRRKRPPAAEEEPPAGGEDEKPGGHLDEYV